MRGIPVVCLLLVGLLSAGCAPMVQVQQAQPFEPSAARVDAEQPDHFWWQLRFKLTWPEGEQPDFSRDLLIAEQLVLPAIIEYEDQLPLWRIHRRAGRTPSGHQFSLVFYSDRETAARLGEQLQSHPLTHWLIDNGMIEKTRFDQRSPEELGRLELASDKDWPLEMQRSWPWFIMGSSQAWLMLVQEISREQGLAGDVSYEDLLVHYQRVDEEVNAQWRAEGQHAYFHHLSALFGYQPLVIRSSELRTF